MTKQCVGTTKDYPEAIFFAVPGMRNPSLALALLYGLGSGRSVVRKQLAYILLAVTFCIFFPFPSNLIYNDRPCRALPPSNRPRSVISRVDISVCRPFWPDTKQDRSASGAKDLCKSISGGDTSQGLTHILSTSSYYYRAAPP